MNSAGGSLEFVSLPIHDREVPDLATVAPELQRMADRLQHGAHIVTHCRFRIGRASLLAASILVLIGVAPDQAWREIERARGLPVPDNAMQRQWPNHLVGHLGRLRSV
jgi:protein-tyrosine phosphatase